MMETIPNDPTLGGPDVQPEVDATWIDAIEDAIGELEDAKRRVGYCRTMSGTAYAKICLDRAERFIDEARRAL